MEQNINKPFIYKYVCLVAVCLFIAACSYFISVPVRVLNTGDRHQLLKEVEGIAIELGYAKEPTPSKVKEQLSYFRLSDDPYYLMSVFRQQKTTAHAALLVEIYQSQPTGNVLIIFSEMRKTEFSLDAVHKYQKLVQQLRSKVGIKQIIATSKTDAGQVLLNE